MLAGLIYIYVGTRLGQRHVSAEAKAAQVCFVLWWCALGVTSLASAGLTMLYMAGRLPMWLYQTFTQATIVLIIGALACLLYYLFFVYSGSPKAWIVPLAYAVITYLVIRGVMNSAPAPVEIADDGWRLVTKPEFSLDPLPALGFAVLFLGPQIGAAIAYAFLWRRAQEATSRYRIAMVSASIIIWFSASLLAGAVGAGETRAWQVASQVISVLAALTVLLAYVPPTAWQRRWGLRSITTETVDRAVAPMDPQ